MNTIKAGKDRYSSLIKPPDAEAKRMNERINSRTIQLDSSNIAKFIENVSLDGFAFCPATFKGGVKARESFEQMQLFALDFHGGISFNQVEARAKRYGLPILFAYDTYSSKNHDRFRVVFSNDIPVSEIKAAEIIRNALGTIFPEAEKTDSDVTGIYYGGSRAILFKNKQIAAITPESVVRGMTAYLYEQSGRTNYKKQIAGFARDNGVALGSSGLLDVTVTEGSTGTTSDTKMPESIILSDTTGNNVSAPGYRIGLVAGSGTTRSSKATRTPRTTYRSIDLTNIGKACKLWGEFSTGNRKLSDSELAGLSTNILQVESGRMKIMDALTIASRYYNEEKRNFWSFNLSYYKQLGGGSWRCDWYCPYRDDCRHGRDILSTAKPKADVIERLAGSFGDEYFTVDEAFEDVRESFNAAVDSSFEGCHIIRAQTAVGKTEIILERVANSPERFLLAVPTNILKQDVLQRAEKMGIKSMVTPSLDEIKDEMPEHVWDRIEELRESGRHRAVNPYIKKVLARKNIRCLGDYLLKLNEFEDFDGLVITTHQKLLHMRASAIRKFDVVVIDEDIIASSILPNHVEIPISNLSKLKKKLEKAEIHKSLQDKVRKVLKAVKTLKDEESANLFSVPAIEWDSEDEDTPTAIDVSSFCSATHFYYRKASEEMKLDKDSIVFLKMVKPKPAKYIMLSATVDETICRYYFGDDMTFHDCKRAEYEGTLNQYYNRTMSRAYIDQHPDIFSQIHEMTGNENVITFKAHSKCEYHFGNTAGCDTMKGQNIDVIGTPHQTDFLYKLFPYSLGIEFDERARIKPRQIVQHNGYSFRFTTYDDEVLRNMQFWLIESELEQAVGRARLLRCDCTVNLFSNFPLRQAVLKAAGFDVGGER